MRTWMINGERTGCLIGVQCSMLDLCTSDRCPSLAIWLHSFIAGDEQSKGRKTLKPYKYLEKRKKKKTREKKFVVTHPSLSAILAPITPSVQLLLRPPPFSSPTYRRTLHIIMITRWNSVIEIVEVFALSPLRSIMIIEVKFGNWDSQSICTAQYHDHKVKFDDRESENIYTAQYHDQGSWFGDRERQK